MQRLPLAAVLMTALVVSACAKGTSSLLDPSAPAGGSPAGGTSGGGAGTSGGGSSTSTIQPVDTTVFTPSDTGSAANTGSSTSLLFFSSGTALYGNGTCGANGTWTDSLGNVSSPHNSHCVAYWSDNRVGNNGKGQCVTSSKGYPGLWLNPQAHPTAPYHTNCLELGTTTSTLTLTFAAQATVYTANDGSLQKVLDFDAGGTTVAQLVYHGAAGDYTTGAGVLTGTDGSAATWTIDFSQTALNYTTGLTNGDLIDVLTSSGTQAIACQAAVGCSLITLKLSVAP
jgi:hypothetical protein